MIKDTNILNILYCRNANITYLLELVTNIFNKYNEL